MEPWEGSEPQLRAKLWYSYNPTRALPISVRFQRIADAISGGALSSHFLLAQPTGYCSEATFPLLRFQGECKALLVNPTYAVAYARRALTGSTLVDMSFYFSALDEGFSWSGQPMRYEYHHCLVDAGLGLILSSAEARPLGEYNLGFLIGGFRFIEGDRRSHWYAEAKKHLGLAFELSTTEELKQSCAKALDWISRNEE